MNEITSKTFEVGDAVGARRWPYSGAHPDCWQPPHKGEVLAVNDPRAWTGTIAFSGVPKQEEVDRHIEALNAHIVGAQDSIGVPVLWSFGRVFFESMQSLVPYSEDCANWALARAAAHVCESDRLHSMEQKTETMGSCG